MSSKVSHFRQKNHEKSFSLANPMFNFALPHNIHLPSERTIYKQMIKQIDLTEDKLKKGIKKKLQKHNIYHQSILEEQSAKILKYKDQRKRSIQILDDKAKQYLNKVIVNRQRKAISQKQQSILNKSKSIQRQRIKWQELVSIHRQQELLNKIKYSEKKIKQLQENRSSSKKSLSIHEDLSALQKVYHRKQKQYDLNKSHSSSNSLRKDTQLSNLSIQLGKKSPLYRNNNNSVENQQRVSKVYSRISTESVSKKYKEMTEADLQISLFQKAQKDKRINQARAVKIYLDRQHQKRNKRINDKSIEDHKQRISQIKDKNSQRNRILNEKFKQNRKSMLDNSLPTIINKTKKKTSISDFNLATIQYESLKQPINLKNMLNKLKDFSEIKQSQRKDIRKIE